ncbi:MAG: 4Fe-4S dicluster domain-containing protein [Clostridia bacterium]|nr:4Fe-4S dicluster domain-containing protein [Clostridia bacterium]
MILNLLELSLNTLKIIGIVAGILAAIAIVLVILILVIGKFFHVDVDEKVEKILNNLAGANCGGCGCSGCSGFAEKLANGTGNLADCHVTSPEKKAEIAKLLGVELANEEPTVAVVKCHGGLENCKYKFAYRGNQSCASTITLLGGDKDCRFGCLGCGDCQAVCTSKAIRVVDRLAEVNIDRCVSCGTCIATCPKHIIERVPQSAKVFVACSSHCRAKEVMNSCKVGCIGCGMCARNCPQKAITMVDNLPVIDYKKCTGCYTCVAKCPRKIIIKMGDCYMDIIEARKAEEERKAKLKAECDKKGLNFDEEEARYQKAKAEKDKALAEKQAAKEAAKAAKADGKKCA